MYVVSEYAEVDYVASSGDVGVPLEGVDCGCGKVVLVYVGDCWYVWAALVTYAVPSD